LVQLLFSFLSQHIFDACRAHINEIHRLARIMYPALISKYRLLVKHSITKYLVWTKGTLRPLWARVRLMTSAKIIINSFGASYTSRSYSAPISYKSNANTRIYLVETKHVFSPYPVQIAWKSIANSHFLSHSGNCVLSKYSAHSEFRSSANALIPCVGVSHVWSKYIWCM
jgi:hypothetical protein